MTPATWRIICLVVSVLCFMVAGAIFQGWVFETESPYAFLSWGVGAYVASQLP